MGKAIGFDPSFRHGSLVFCEFKDHQMVDLRIIYSWGKREGGIDYKRPITEAFQFCNPIINTLPQTNLEIAPPIAIDWEPQSVYWRATKLQVVQMGSVIGYLAHGFLQRGYPVVFITPAEVRKFFNIPLRSSEKDVVYEKFLRIVHGADDILKRYTRKLALDIMDSIVLAYMVDSLRASGSHLVSLEDKHA